MLEQPKSEDIAWLNEVLNGPKSIGGPLADKYLPQPNAQEPTFLLPIENSKVSKSALSRYSDDKSLQSRGKAMAGQLMAATGILKAKPHLAKAGEPILLPRWDIVGFFEEQLNVSNLSMAVTLGGRRRNRKPVLQLIEPDGETIGFAKIGWSKMTSHVVNNEAALLQSIHPRLPDSLITPDIKLHTQWNGYTIAVLGAVPASPLAHRRVQHTGALFEAIAESHGIKSVEFSECPQLQDDEFSPVSQHVDVEALKAQFGDVDVALGTWHGDLTPWNTSTVFGRTAIWDWEFAALETPVGFDQLHCRFETHRRNEGTTPLQALQETQKESKDILSELDQNPEAIFALYLCELAKRELLLAGQRWDYKAMQLLDEIKQLLPELAAR